MECRVMRIPCMVLCLILLSCSKEKDITHWHYASSYVFEYVQYEKIISHTGVWGELIVQVIPNDSYGAFSTSEADVKKYDAKCQLYEDVGYDLKFWSLECNSYENCVQDRDFEAIKIYSDKDFLVNYPSGANLAPLYYIASRSPYRYIKSKYSLPHNGEIDDYPPYYREYLNNKRGIDFAICDGVYPVFGVVSNLSSEDMKLLGFGNHWTSPFEMFTLYPTCLPDDKTIHSITIELLDSNGEILTCCVDVDFSMIKVI